MSNSLTILPLDYSYDNASLAPLFAPYGYRNIPCNTIYIAMLFNPLLYCLFQTGRGALFPYTFRIVWYPYCTSTPYIKANRNSTKIGELNHCLGLWQPGYASASTS